MEFVLGPQVSGGSGGAFGGRMLEIPLVRPLVVVVIESVWEAL